MSGGRIDLLGLKVHLPCRVGKGLAAPIFPEKKAGFPEIAGRLMVAGCRPC